jgi:hypothetical protein
MYIFVPALCYTLEAVQCQPKKSPLDHDCCQLVGICTIQSSLAAVKKLVIKHQELTYELFVRWLLSRAVLEAAVAAAEVIH